VLNFSVSIKSNNFLSLFDVLLIFCSV
jgi:hypothetical protein